MHKNRENLINNIHLIISVLVVVPAAFIYAFEPNLILDMYVEIVDERNFHKAIMGIYLGFSSLWLLGIFKKEYWKIAIFTNIIFMLGLGFGRVVSILLDGLPTTPYLIGTFGELILGFYGVWILKRN